MSKNLEDGTPVPSLDLGFTPKATLMGEFFKLFDKIHAGRLNIKAATEATEATAASFMEKFKEVLAETIAKSSHSVLVTVYFDQLEDLDFLLQEIAEEDLSYLRYLLSQYQDFPRIRISEDASTELLPFVGFIVDARQFYEALSENQDEVVLKDTTLVLGRHCSVYGILFDFKTSGAVKQCKIETNKLSLDEGERSVGAGAERGWAGNTPGSFPPSETSWAW